jgi:hypothetical protein
MASETLPVGGWRFHFLSKLYRFAEFTLSEVEGLAITKGPCGICLDYLGAQGASQKFHVKHFFAK